MASVTGAITSAWVWAFRAGQDRDRPCCQTWEHLRWRACRRALPLPLWCWCFWVFYLFWVASRNWFSI